MSKISLEEFNELNLAGRAQVLWDHGEHMADLELTGKQYTYFSVGRFFAEVEYERTIKLRMIGIQGFIDGASKERLDQAAWVIDRP